MAETRDDERLKLVRQLLKDPMVSEGYKGLVQQLASDHLELERIRKSYTQTDVVPDMERFKFQGIIRSHTGNERHSQGSRLTEEQARSQLREHLVERHRELLLHITDSLQARKMVEAEIKRHCMSEGLVIEGMDIEGTIKYLLDDVLDYGVLTDFIYDTESMDYEEVRVNDHNDIRVVVKGRERSIEAAFDTPEQLLSICHKLCRNAGVRYLSKEHPFCRLRLGNNIRVSMMSHPVARRSGSNSKVIQMVIRKQSRKPFDRSFLCQSGTLDEWGFELLEMCMRYGASMNFYGGTNSGKTGTLAALVNHVFSTGDTRVITIAEIDEMDLRRVDPFTGKALNNAIMWEVQSEFGFRKAINASLTFTPETLILQETKGEEVVDVIDAAITGHQLLTSSHAKNINVFGKRMLGMYKQSGSDLSDDLILEYVAEAFDILVRMKIHKNGARRVSEISELLSYDRPTGRFEVNCLYRFTITDAHGNGYHELMSPMSDRLKDLLMENGLPTGVYERLEAARVNQKERR